MKQIHYLTCIAFVTLFKTKDKSRSECSSVWDFGIKFLGSEKQDNPGLLKTQIAFSAERQP